MDNLIKTTLAAASFVILTSGVSVAGVAFLPATEAGAGSSGSVQVSSGEKCQMEGYLITSCDNGYVLTGSCPHNGSYYQSCCPEGYKFTQEECTKAGLRYSRNSCGGLYKCL